MHKRKETEKSFNNSLNFSKNAQKKSISSSILKTDRVCDSQNIKSSEFSISNLINEDKHALTEMIEKKVSNLKHKFGELAGLREKLLESSPNKTSERAQISLKSRIKSSDSLKTIKCSDKTCETISKTEHNNKKPGKDQENNFIHSFNPNFEQFLYNSELFHEKKTEKTSELEILNTKLLQVQKELSKSEHIRISQESLITKQLLEIKEFEETEKIFKEANKSLKLQILRLENQIKNIGQSKSTSTNAIKNLSYIILSKDSNRESPKKTNHKSFLLKYLENLNDLHTSDQFTLKILEKLENRKNSEACAMLKEIQTTIFDRLENTCKNVEEIEKLVYETQPEESPVKEKVYYNKELKGKTHANDYLCFLKCEAAMVEELLMR